MDIFLNDFLIIAQVQTHNRRNVRHTLFHDINAVFWTIDNKDGEHQKEALSLKKLKSGYCSLQICQVLLGCIFYSINLTIFLPLHWYKGIMVILGAIPTIQKWVSVYKWHQVLGELWLMVTHFPCARGLLSQIQEALQRVKFKKAMLTRGVYNSLEDFHWLPVDLSDRPNHIIKLVTLNLTLIVNHDASGYMCGGPCIPGPTAIPSCFLQWHPILALQSTDLTTAHPRLWRAHFQADVVANLVYFDKPNGSVTNSNIDIVEVILHNACDTQCFDNQ